MLSAKGRKNAGFFAEAFKILAIPKEDIHKVPREKALEEILVFHLERFAQREMEVAKTYKELYDILGYENSSTKARSKAREHLEQQLVRMEKLVDFYTSIDQKLEVVVSGINLTPRIEKTMRDVAVEAVSLRNYLNK